MPVRYLGSASDIRRAVAASDATLIPFDKWFYLYSGHSPTNPLPEGTLVRREPHWLDDKSSVRMGDGLGGTSFAYPEWLSPVEKEEPCQSGT